MMRPDLIAVALLALAGSTGARDEAPALEELSWLAGHWVRDEGGSRSEEIWLPPSGNTMLGMNQTITGDLTIAFEYVRIVRLGEAIDYVAQPGGKSPVAFRLVQWGENRAVFENPEHDFPQRISYVRTEDRLDARISGPSGGEEKSVGWTWVLAGSSSAPSDVAG